MNASEETIRWRFWELVEQARQANARALHLRPGHPPLIRRETRELVPLGSPERLVASADLMRELSVVVEPEAWQRFETHGSGEISAFSPTGDTVQLALFRSLGVWSVVVHL